VPHIQVHRFASKGLAGEIDRIWHGGVENPEVREVLISLIEAGRINACAPIVFRVAWDTEASAVERIIALRALVAIDDERLGEIAAGIADANDCWPDLVARVATLRLFPKYMSVEQLCQALRWIKRKNHRAGDLSWQLSELIAASSLDFPALEKLRNGLVILVSEGLKWQENWPHITSSDRSYLSGALAATCERGLDISKANEWLHASALALRLHHGDDQPIKSLQERLINLNAKDNARLFWTVDALLQSLHEVKEPWKRFTEITTFHDSLVELRPDRDLVWVSDALGDTTRDTSERAMLLEAAIRLSPDRDTWREHVGRLRAYP
jgi:hypothetical protein